MVAAMRPREHLERRAKRQDLLPTNTTNLSFRALEVQKQHLEPRPASAGTASGGKGRWPCAVLYGPWSG